MKDDLTPAELEANAEDMISDEMTAADEDCILFDDDPAPYVDPREGWFKIIAPGIAQMFGTMLAQEKVQVVPYIYGRLDGSEVAFDDQLSEPMLIVSDALIGIVDPAKGANDVSVLPVTRLNPEHTNRCYIPMKIVMGMLPLDPKSESVSAFISVTSAVGLTLPTPADIANMNKAGMDKVIGLDGKPITE